ncbi:hypothetical protein J4Q44_G00073500 [Coregonus suidteri]|uniref:Uncharacterized protein n=1 Tax=Coregonus suidteri TaxID=861788 RepID=A0AAN8M0W4_9TELE
MFCALSLGPPFPNVKLPDPSRKDQRKAVVLRSPLAPAPATTKVDCSEEFLLDTDLPSTPLPTTPSLPLTASPLGPSRDEVASSSWTTDDGQSPLELPVMTYWPSTTGRKRS